MIVINFKNYAFGKDALRIARKIEKYLPRAIIAVLDVDIEYLRKNTKLGIYAQHVDYEIGEKNTGFLTPDSLKKAGAKGSLLNHSEHKMEFEDIMKTTRICKKLGLKLIICSSSLFQARKIMKLKPYAIAFESPELIGTGKSITKYRGKDVSSFSKMLKGKGIIALCGAGINSKEDVLEAKRLGCNGVLISSAVMKAKSDKLLKQL